MDSRLLCLCGIACTLSNCVVCKDAETPDMTEMCAEMQNASAAYCASHASECITVSCVYPCPDNPEMEVSALVSYEVLEEQKTYCEMELGLYWRENHCPLEGQDTGIPVSIACTNPPCH